MGIREGRGHGMCVCVCVCVTYAGVSHMEKSNVVEPSWWNCAPQYPELHPVPVAVDR